MDKTQFAEQLENAKKTANGMTGEPPVAAGKSKK